MEILMWVLFGAIVWVGVIWLGSAINAFMRWYVDRHHGRRR